MDTVDTTINGTLDKITKVNTKEKERAKENLSMLKDKVKAHAVKENVNKEREQAKEKESLEAIFMPSSTTRATMTSWDNSTWYPDAFTGRYIYNE